MPNHLAAVLIVSLACAGCAGVSTQIPPSDPWSEFPASAAKPAAEGLACRLLLASSCSYRVEAALDEVKAKNAGTLADGACPSLPAMQTFGVRGRRLSHDSVDEARDAVLVLLTENEVIIAFRGTLPPGHHDANFLIVTGDWLNDGRAPQVKDPIIGVDVHQGFLDSLDAMWDPLIARLSQWRDEGKLPKKLYVTGHSKGGALAQIASLRLKAVGFVPTATYTYAAARAGGDQFAAFYEASGIATTRYENQGDIVPHLPPTQDEFQAFRRMSDPFLNRIEHHLEYRSVGTLQFIRDNLAVITPTPSTEDHLDQVRLKAFESAMEGQSHARLVETLAANHSIDAPKAPSGTDFRYFRAVCGNERE